MTNELGSIVSVVVTYNPEKERLNALLSNALPQVSCLVIVDNGSNSAVLEWIRELVVPERVALIELGTNLGIAAAQNVGIKYARQLRAAFVLLFDHDSIPEQQMVKVLMNTLLSKVEQGIKIAAVGPRYFDERQNNPPPFIEVRGLRVVRHSCSGRQDCVPVSYVIASGSLIPVTTLDVVGDMREDLFIDYVDIEWGLRAAAMGYQTFGVCNALMQHDLGDAPLTFMRRSIPLHSPLRHYYLFRNALLLYKQKNLPFLWKVGDAWRLGLKYGFYALYGQSRMAQVKMMSLGLWHGLRGRAGPLR